MGKFAWKRGGNGQNIRSFRRSEAKPAPERTVTWDSTNSRILLRTEIRPLSNRNPKRK